MKEIVTLDHGSGGLRTSELIEQVLLPAYGNAALNELGDGAVLSDLGGSPVFSTDSFVVTPWRFPGGNIGKLAVCGTINDVCMAGGEPKYLSLALILEEGFAMDDLREIVASAAETAKACGVQIVTGDTKVVERGHVDGIYINTAGIGVLRAHGLGRSAIRPGDAVLVSGSVGCHGAAVMMARGDIPCEGTLLSDCCPLHALSKAALDAGGVRILRDPTRGGVATTLNEFVEHGPFCIELEEDAIPVDPAVAAACDLLGLDPLYAACEGRMLAVVDPTCVDAVLSALHALPGGEGAVQIGRVTTARPGQVMLNAAFGSRILSKLTGAQLPRIC
ncbi:hydrogenase expression/formation protein HypE [Subdoligranulum sp. DSM 109015]|uniref:Hydrogenase expression/formation protein HypE n=1 Tax=Gemmiger gallinarum TaxID=2779354 RepID=A0ABR9QZG9_9FIRM|nr:hydrogenase expression/formation protein HypE [Gemmiger gallinarum]MBE5036278.1 hydrogenase expression/formation protein HypE [Gemmiger gallinarum]